jgi:hypothetical protein
MRFFILGSIILSVLFLLYFMGLYHYIAPISEYSLQKAALLGDSYGLLNTFISGLAFLGIIQAIILQRNQLNLQLDELKLQREELELQREEIKLNRRELERSAIAQEGNQKALESQMKIMEITKNVSLINELYKFYDGRSRVQGDEGKLYKKRFSKCIKLMNQYFDSLDS